MLSISKIFIFAFLMVSYLIAGDLLPIGTEAPDFSLPDAKGKTHKLSDYQGHIVVIYFYPKDGTPGCTKEACNLRDNYEVLLEKGIVILGISYDDADSHKEFTEKYQLPFTLLSDKDKKVADLYGAKGGLMGFIGAKRITYLVDETGKIMHVFDKVDTGGHAEQILEVIEEKDNADRHPFRGSKKVNMKPDTTVIE